MSNPTHAVSRSLIFATLLYSCSSSLHTTSTSNAGSAAEKYYSADDFNKVRKIDAHIHIYTDKTAFIQQALKDNFRLLTISADDPGDSVGITQKDKWAFDHCRAFPETVKYITTFSVRNFNESNWLDSTIRKLDASLSQGAIGVKIYKVIGMWLRDSDGKLVMIDDKRFDPLIAFLTKRNVPVLGHLGEPKNCWLPVEQMTVAGDRHYFTVMPEFHMYSHPEFPSYEEQIAARDRMLEKNPQLRFIGAHMGSLEWSVDELAKRLDKFPNMAVDMAARICHWQHQAVTDWKKVRDFCIKYQDRLLYATDLFTDGSQGPGEFEQHAHDEWMRDWKFFVTGDELTAPQVTGAFNGLKLPAAVIDKLYRTNAEKWFLSAQGK